MCNFLSIFRFGNPVIYNNKVTIVTKVPNSTNLIDGYKVYGNPDSIPKESIKGIPLVKEVYDYYSFKDNGFANYSFIADGHKVEIENGVAYIDGKEFGKLSFLHELVNLLNDECTFTLKQYWPSTETRTDASSTKE